MTSAGVTVPGRLHAAFASTPRERFLGPGPWKVLTANGYIETPSDDVTFVYRDMPIALEAQLGINNGQPFLHALCLAAVAVQEGEKVTHIGSGTGYYTAILAQLAWPAGCIYSMEIHPSLAARSRTNLVEFGNVRMMERSGSEGEIPSADVVYVSAGATGPQNLWLDALRPGGRLLFPLTPTQGSGGMLLITRTAAENWDARFVSAAMFIGCAGARDEEMARRLTDAFGSGGSKNVQSLRRHSRPDETCWFAGKDWWLSTAPAARGKAGTAL